MSKRFVLVVGGAVVGAAVAAAAVWMVWFRPPYALADAPAVDVTVRAEKSEYPDVADTAEDVEAILQVYVQRLKAKDTAGLAALAGPDFDRPDAEARKLVRTYADGATRGHVTATVQEGVVPYFNDVTLTYDETGQRQRLLLVHDDRMWWLALGDGDPAAGLETAAD